MTEQQLAEIEALTTCKPMASDRLRYIEDLSGSCSLLIAHIRKLEAERLTADEREVVSDALSSEIGLLSEYVGKKFGDSTEFDRLVAVRAKIEAMGGGEG